MENSNTANNINNTNNHEEILITINKTKLCLNFIFFSMSVIYLYYYTYYYFQLPTNSIITYNSILLLISLLHYHCYNVIYCYYCYIDYILYGQTLTNTQYKYEKRLPRFINLPYDIFSDINAISLILQVPIFIPFTKNNCSFYVHNLCIFGRINAFFGIILIIIYSLFLLFITILFCYAFYNGMSLTDFVSVFNSRSSNNVNNFVSYVISEDSLKFLNLIDEECPICLESNIENENFVELSCCKNKFHYKCITTYANNVSGNKLCPICRNPLQLLESPRLSHNLYDQI